LVFLLMDRESRSDVINFIHDNVIHNKDQYIVDRNKDRCQDLYENVDFCDRLANCINSLMADPGLRGDSSVLSIYIKGRLQNLFSAENKVEDNIHSKRMMELTEQFYLDEDDITLLVFLYCVYGINISSLNNIPNDMTYNDFLKFTSVATGVSLGKTKRALSKNGRLYECGLLSDIDPRGNDFYSLEGFVTDYISGVSETGLVARYVKRDWGITIPLENFTVDIQSVDIISLILSSPGPCNILLYGTAGTGKTEFARSVVQSVGLDTYFLQFGDTDNKGNSRGDVSSRERIAALNIGAKSVDSQRGVLVVDEADFILNTRYMFMSHGSSAEKGWLNSFLDGGQAKMIWISNETGYMEESTLRRFSYSYQFDGFTIADRVNVFHNRIAEHPLKKYIDDDMIYRLAGDFRVNAGGIAASLDCVGKIVSPGRNAPREIERSLRDILSRHEKLIYSDKHSDTSGLAGITAHYDISVLNTDNDPQQLIHSSRMFYGAINKAAPDEKISMNVLFWGEPGTGKTEFAKYLAKELKRRLLVKRYSDLESMWVGETEKKIRRAFREAEKSGSILFVDEADSFFTSRENAQHSWEVSRTNEFLTQMENHRGMLICCTNLLPQMDRAAMRRFNWKMEFLPLKPEQRVALYGRYFRRKGCTITASMKERVRNIEGLTPGDIRSVWNRNRFLDAAAFNHHEVIEALEKEVAYRTGSAVLKVGFQVS
nr:AAA family ATPase [Spirochaetota bacterium]